MAAIDPTTQQKLLDAIVQLNAVNSGRGSYSSVAQTVLSQHDRYGLAPVQINAEHVGLTFFTCPRLNFTTQSIRQDRVLAMLDTLDPNSYMFSIRAYLDRVFSKSGAGMSAATISPFFNSQSPFNVPMGNLLAGISGWPDFNVEVETTESGYYAEDMTTARGNDWGRRTYNLMCTFREWQGGYLMAMFYYWLTAMSLQMDGAIVAYPDDREANRLNYTISIYRFILDPSMTTIVKWAKATGCFPTSLPIGDNFNYGVGDSFIHTSQQFSVPFVANNIRYMDPAHLNAFNQLVLRYCPSIASYTKVPISAGPSGNFTGIPYIDLTTGQNELKFMSHNGAGTNTAQTTVNSIITSLNTQLTTSAAATTGTTALNTVAPASISTYAAAATTTTPTSPIPTL